MNTLNITSCFSHKVITISRSSYLCDLISVQPPRSTRSSFVVTISRRPTSSSLNIASSSFRYSATYLWNQLPESFREPHPHLSISASQSHFLGHIRSLFSSASPLPPYPHSLFHTNHFHHSLPIIDYPWTNFTVTRPAQQFFFD